jgi:hypothetical protein
VLDSALFRPRRWPVPCFRCTYCYIAANASNCVYCRKCSIMYILALCKRVLQKDKNKMSKFVDWSEWVLQKNNEAQEEEMKNSDSVQVDSSLNKSSSGHPDTEKFLAGLSSRSDMRHGPGHGEHFIVTPHEAGFDNAQPDDVAVYSDHGDSHDPSHLGSKDFSAFNLHMGDQKAAIARHMAQKGYHSVEDNDGSGGGLHYGATLYRKMPSNPQSL